MSQVTQQILDAADAGMVPKAIADKVQRNVKTVYKLLRENGRRRNATPEGAIKRQARMAQMFRDGLTVTQIAGLINLCREHTARELVRAGVDLRTERGSATYEFWKEHLAK